MLGRLRLSLDECIEALNDLATDVFALEKIKNENTKKPIFDATKMEAFAKKLVKKYLGDEEALMCPEDQLNAKHDLHDNTPRGRVYVPLFHNESPFHSFFLSRFVCAHRAVHIGQPARFRSYRARQNNEDNCKIWEAIRATTACPTLFDRISIGNGILKQEFIDAGMGYNNPVKELLHEAQNMHPQIGITAARQIDCIISIGTGKRTTLRYEVDLHQQKRAWWRKMKPGRGDRFSQFMKDLLHDCESVHQDMARGCTLLEKDSDYGVYFRLNVEQGLQEISEMETKDLGNVIAHTKAYVYSINFKISAQLDCRYQADADTELTMNKAIAALTGRYTQEFLSATEEYSSSPFLESSMQRQPMYQDNPPVIIEKASLREEYVAPSLNYL